MGLGDVILRIRAGDSDALSELMQFWREALGHVVYRILNDPGAIDEVVSETFEWIWETRESIPTDPKDALAVAGEVALHDALDRKKKMKRTKKREIGAGFPGERPRDLSPEPEFPV